MRDADSDDDGGDDDRRLRWTSDAIDLTRGRLWSRSSCRADCDAGVWGGWSRIRPRRDASSSRVRSLLGAMGTAARPVRLAEAVVGGRGGANAHAIIDATATGGGLLLHGDDGDDDDDDDGDRRTAIRPMAAAAVLLAAVVPRPRPPLPLTLPRSLLP